MIHQLIRLIVDDSQLHNESDRLQAAERDCLDARAAYLLRNSIVESVLINEPVLNAVHSGVNATPSERSSTTSVQNLPPGIAC